MLFVFLFWLNCSCILQGQTSRYNFQNFSWTRIYHDLIIWVPWSLISRHCFLLYLKYYMYFVSIKPKILIKIKIKCMEVTSENGKIITCSRSESNSSFLPLEIDLNISAGIWFSCISNTWHFWIPVLRQPIAKLETSYKLEVFGFVVDLNLFQNVVIFFCLFFGLFLMSNRMYVHY